MTYIRPAVISLTCLAIGGAFAFGAICLPALDGPPVLDESRAVSPRLAAPEQALSFARHRGTWHLVGHFDGTTAELIALPEARAADTPFTLIERLGRDALIARTHAAGVPTPLAALEAVPLADRHVAAGTNFADHAAEVAIDPVFLYPKRAAPTPPVSTLSVPEGAMMDYEVEVCASFDRPVASPDDLSEARAALVLCADMTDRATLYRLLDTDAPENGRGFTDAKSGAGRLPTGPFMVVPADWRGFLRDEAMSTRVNGHLVQSGVLSDMRLDFDALAALALDPPATMDLQYQGRSVPMLDTGRIETGQAILSGTPAGVVAEAPTGSDIVCGAVVWVCLGDVFRGVDPVAGVMEAYVARNIASDIFLAPRDVVRMESARLGVIEVTMTE